MIFIIISFFLLLCFLVDSSKLEIFQNDNSSKIYEVNTPPFSLGNMNFPISANQIYVVKDCNEMNSIQDSDIEKISNNSKFIIFAVGENRACFQDTYIFPCQSRQWCAGIFKEEYFYAPAGFRAWSVFSKHRDRSEFKVPLVDATTNDFYLFYDKIREAQKNNLTFLVTLTQDPNDWEKMFTSVGFMFFFRGLTFIWSSGCLFLCLYLLIYKSNPNATPKQAGKFQKQSSQKDKNSSQFEKSVSGIERSASFNLNDQSAAHSITQIKTTSTSTPATTSTLEPPSTNYKPRTTSQSQERKESQSKPRTISTQSQSQSISQSQSQERKESQFRKGSQPQIKKQSRRFRPTLRQICIFLHLLTHLSRTIWSGTDPLFSARVFPYAAGHIFLGFNITFEVVTNILMAFLVRELTIAVKSINPMKNLKWGYIAVVIFLIGDLIIIFSSAYTLSFASRMEAVKAIFYMITNIGLGVWYCFQGYSFFKRVGLIEKATKKENHQKNVLTKIVIVSAVGMILFGISVTVVLIQEIFGSPWGYAFSWMFIVTVVQISSLSEILLFGGIALDLALIQSLWGRFKSRISSKKTSLSDSSIAI